MPQNSEPFFHYKGETVPIEKIETADIRPDVPELGGSTIILQRNAKDDRRPGSPDFGALDEKAAELARIQAKEFFEKIFSSLTGEERGTIDIMVVASDATLVTPYTKAIHKRAVETGVQVLSGLTEAMQNASVAEQQLLNNSANHGSVVEVSELKDLLMMEESPDFVEFLRSKYGTGVEFWNAYENDVEKETRLKMKAEGPDDIADRVNYALSLQAQIAREYHEANPGRRLIIWAISHYDSISPFAKKHVTNTDLNTYLPIEQGGGITIAIDKDGGATCTLKDKKLVLRTSN